MSDSKGLYDSLNNELPQDDKKSAVEMPIIEEIMGRMKGRSRWIPHNCNPAGGLTKLKGAHLEPSLQLLLVGCYLLKTEEAQLKSRADAKEKDGRIQRFKKSGIVRTSFSSFACMSPMDFNSPEDEVLLKTFRRQVVDKGPERNRFALDHFPHVFR